MLATKSSKYTESSATASQVNELMEHIRTFRRIPKGYRAIHMHFSILDRMHQQPHHRRDIATAFNKIIGSHEGKLFWMSNFDFFFICKDCPNNLIEQAKIDAIRAVDDSEIIKRMIDESKDDEICDWYDLGEEYEKFFLLVEGIIKSADNPDEEDNKNPTLQNLMANLDQDNDAKPKKNPDVVEKPEKSNKNKTVPDYSQIFPKEKTPEMGPVELDKLERNIMTMDVFSLISEHNICVVMDKMPPQLVYSKKYISIGELGTNILPGYNIAADKWLFQRLTKTFDKKLMQSLIDYKSFPDNVLAINLNVETILSKDFDNFISKYKSLSNHPLILEITLVDILSNLNEYYKAQKKATNHGCKICICNMDIQSLYVIDRELISVDFLKVKWNKNYKNILTDEDKERLIKSISHHGKMRVVLSHCDSKEAFEFGKKMGIVMYQGFSVEKL